MLDSPGLLLKRLVLLFWAMYFSLVALTNFVNLLDELGAFDWTFLDSENFSFLESVVEVYDVGSVITKLLLFGAFLIELTAAVLFWRGLMATRRGSHSEAMLAICFGTFVWTAFVFMTEFFVAYKAEAPFRELMAIMLASAITVALVPDDAGTSRPA